MTYKQKRLKLFNACVKRAIEIEQADLMYEAFTDQLAAKVKNDIAYMLKMFIDAGDVENLKVDPYVDSGGELRLDITYDEPKNHQYVHI